MANAKTDLSKFNNSTFDTGGNAISRTIWYFINVIVLKGPMPFMRPKRFWLRVFGAKVGKGLVIKPHVSVKYPWNLEIGDNVWIGENVWIDNLGKIKIGSNVCISQGAMIMSGNHNFSKSNFELMVKEISIEDGAWLGAKSLVCQGVTVGSHAVLSVSSVASENLEPYSIYRGNPATKIKDRVIES
ncbi:MAG: WcaF family extracellular polysaccharide biosynthesis acetyltransferase [Bacteroidota bacterium]|nr:WcaF family extracellular polysaccharide biosynthesis acetyltransferase [Bacteroidota bacterium]